MPKEGVKRKTSSDILSKKPWLFEYYYPLSGSRYMVLRTMYEDNKKEQS